MKHICNFFFLLFIPFFSNAQSNYKPGYVVTLKGDTLHGFIDYHEWDKNPKEIRFKQAQNDAKTENYSAGNAGAFAVNDQVYYERYVLSVSQDYLDIGKLGSKVDNATKTDTVFLRLVNKGSHLALYCYADDIKPRYFLKESGEPLPQELDYHAYQNPNESSLVKYSRRYRIQLQYAAQKYNAGAVAGRISQSLYTEANIRKIVQAINGNSSTQFTTQRLFGTRWFAGLGVNYSQLKFEPASDSYKAGPTEYINSVFPKVSGGVDLFVNKNIRALVLRAELSFTVNQFRLTTNNDFTVPQSTSILNIKQYNPSITPQVIYNIYNAEQLKVFIGAGASFNFSSYNRRQYITKYGGSFPDDVRDSFSAFSKSWVSFPLKTGIEINRKLEINICYTPSALIAYDSPFSSNIKSYQAGINYLFGQ